MTQLTHIHINVFVKLIKLTFFTCKRFPSSQTRNILLRIIISIKNKYGIKILSVKEPSTFTLKSIFNLLRKPPKVNFVSSYNIYILFYYLWTIKHNSFFVTLLLLQEETTKGLSRLKLRILAFLSHKNSS